GHELFQDRADVVVCDGFVGNVVVKASEGLAGYMQAELRRALSSSVVLRLMAPLLRRALQPKGPRLGPDRPHGAVLLGLQGVVVKSHGKADQQALEVAISQAVTACRSQMPQRIAARLARCRDELL